MLTTSLGGGGGGAARSFEVLGTGSDEEVKDAKMPQAFDVPLIRDTHEQSGREIAKAEGGRRVLLYGYVRDGGVEKVVVGDLRYVQPLT